MTRSAHQRRWLFGLESATLAVLSLVACVLAIELAESNYVRLDASADGRNTLPPEIADRIDRLPAPVEVDVFFRPLQAPFERPARDARGRFLELLYQAQNARRDVVGVTVHDFADPAAVRSRQRELGVEGTQLVVFSSGGRRASFGLFDEIADVDWGNPTLDQLNYLANEGLGNQLNRQAWSPDPRAVRPPFLARFRGADVVATALAKVSSGEPPRVTFLTGHGEPALDTNEEAGLSRLARALRTDGFEVESWDPAEDRAVPESTDVLAVIGSRQPIRAEVREVIHDWVDDGGRLFVASAVEEALGDLEGAASAIAFRYGMVVERGVACRVFQNALQQSVEGDPRCAELTVGEVGLSASHPVTEPLRMRGARVTAVLAPTLRAGQHPGGSQPLALISTPAEAWLDLVGADGAPNFRLDPGESRARRALALFAEYGLARIEGDEFTGSRVIGVGTTMFAENRLFDANRDFLLNAFNHLAERDFRIGVTPRERREARLDLRSDSALATLSLALGLVLPGFFVVVGAVLAWRRRS
ncbi:MAG: DUF4350 domain-containing protein [Planctomycetota bacterium]